MSSSTYLIRQIRTRHGAASSQWMDGLDGTRTYLSAVRRGEGEALPVCLFDSGHNPADVEFLACAHADIATLMGMVERAARVIREMKAKTETGPEPAEQTLEQPDETGPKDYTTQAAMLCADTGFQGYLKQNHGLQYPDYATPKVVEQLAAKALHRVLQIASRKELNTNPEAATRWQNLHRDYVNWSNGR